MRFEAKLLLSFLTIVGCVLSQPRWALAAPPGDGSFAYLKARCQNMILPSDLQSEKYHWYEASSGKKMKAVALVVHGLNNRPHVMLPLIAELNQQGIGVLNVGLTGYTGPFSDLQKVTANQWLQDVFIGNCLLQTKANQLPQYFAGFSLGALITETLLISNLSEKFEFEKLLLLSPAMRLKDRSQWIRLYSFMGRARSMISFAPRRYAANWKTPNAAYEALFDLIDLYDKNLAQNPQKINVPTLVFVDPKDELVSSEYLEEMVAVSGLDQWQMNLINKDETAQTWFHHVTVDEQAVGQKTWSEMLDKIKKFF